jgi:hypothetical protein
MYALHLKSRWKQNLCLWGQFLKHEFTPKGEVWPPLEKLTAWGVDVPSFTPRGYHNHVFRRLEGLAGDLHP